MRGGFAPSLLNSPFLPGKGFILKVHPEGFILSPPMADEGTQGIGKNKQPDANRTSIGHA